MLLLRNIGENRTLRHRADFQQYDPEGQAITTRWGGHEPILSLADPRPLDGLVEPEKIAKWELRHEVGATVDPRAEFAAVLRSLALEQWWKASTR